MKKLTKTVETEMGKWIQSVTTALIRSANYKIDFILTLIIPVGVYFFIKYNLWTSIYHFNSKELLGGWTLSKMIQYQFWILILDLFVRSHFFSQTLSEDIRLGRISAFLLYPFGFIKYQLSLFISDKIIQLFVGAAAFLTALWFGWMTPLNPLVLIKFFTLILMVSGFWFVTQTLVGLLAFWLEETWSLNICIRFIAAFLSGSLLPLDLYPPVLTKVLLWTPFPYLIYFPVKLLMGESLNFGFIFLILAGWIAVLALLMRWLWQKGLRLYTGSGI